MSFETRLNDPEYQNWLKCGQALILLVGSLRPLAEDTIKTFHGTLQNELGHLGVCQQNCKSKKKPDDGCAVCGPWKQKLMEKHSTKEVFWTNTDPKSWPGDQWEIAKVYMSRGQKPNQPITAADLDATHMLNLIKNCKEFHAHVPKKLPEKVLQKRNKIMHSSQMKLTDNDSQDIIDLFTQFLQDKTKLHALPETQKAVQEIQQLDKTAFAVNIQQKHAGSQSAGTTPPKVMSEKETKQLERTLIQNMVEDFNKRLEVLESTEELSFDDGAESKVLRKSVEDLQNFVNDNTDLKEVFGRGLDDLKGKYDYLEEKYEYLEEKVEEINEGFQEMYIRLGAVEDKPLPDSDITYDEEPTGEHDLFMIKAIKGTTPVLVCLIAIGVLLMYYQSQNHLYNPHSTGQICSVTVAGHTYRTPRPHRTKQEAKQDAAHMTYLILKERIKSGQHKPAQLVDDPTNYIGKLQEYTQQRKLPKPEYCPKNKNTVDMLFTASVEVELPDGRTVEFENPQAEKTLQRAKRGAAQQALKEIERQLKGTVSDKQQKSEPSINVKPSLNPHTSKAASDVKFDLDVPSTQHYKSRLQEALQKSFGATSPPKYEDVEQASQPGTFRSKITINAKHMIQSGLFASKKEAEKDAARLALQQLGLQPTDNPKGSVLQLPTKVVFETEKMQDTNQFQSILLSAALENINTVVLSCGGKTMKDAQEEAAKKACEKLGILDEVKESAAEEPSKSVTYVTYVDAELHCDVEKQPFTHDAYDASADYKSRLQVAIQKAHGSTSPPKYEDVEIASQPGTFRSKVTVNAKHMIQSGLFTSKKEAERDVAKLALKQLEQDPTDNPKGRVLQLHPKTAFVTGKVPETKQFQSVLFLPAVETLNTVVVYSDSTGKTKKEGQDVQQSLAKNMCEKLGVQDEVKCSNVGEPSKTGAGAVPKSPTGKPPPSPDTQGESNIVPCGSMENETLSATETYSCITKVETVDSHGAVLCLPISDQKQAGVVLKIAKGALEQATIVSVSVDPCEQHPPVKEDQLILGSVISCQPEGQTFLKPVTISVPHSGINVTEECLQVWCKSDSDGGMGTWRKIYDGQAKYAEKDVSVVVEGDRIKVRVTHFSMFDFVTVAVSALASWIRPPEQMLTVIAYMDPVNVETCRNVCLRVYANDRASRKMIETEEKLHDSGMCCIPAGPWLKPNGFNLIVRVHDIDPEDKWLPAAAAGEILYDNIQVGGIESRCEIKFKSKDAVDHAECFEGSVDIKQEGNAKCVKGFHTCISDKMAREYRNRDRENNGQRAPTGVPHNPSNQPASHGASGKSALEQPVNKSSLFAASGFSHESRSSTSNLGDCGPFLKEVARQIEPKWRDVAYTLEFTPAQVEEFQGGWLPESWWPAYKMLLSWQTKLPPCEFKQLLDILADAVRPIDEELASLITGS